MRYLIEIKDNRGLGGEWENWDSPRTGHFNADVPHDAEGWMRNKRKAEQAMRFLLRAFTRYEPRLITLSEEEYLDRQWHKRERDRFENGTYDKVPWANEAWANKHPDHFVHMSVEQPGKIAFTPDKKKGLINRKTVMLPGRYLAKFFGKELSQKEIERWSAATCIAGGEYELHFTQDADEIEYVYRRGPSSCMSKNPSAYAGHCHPVRVYAGPDLALAYFGHKDKAMARCIVWPEKKLYGRIYGDVEKMKIMLEHAGYKEGVMEGARIQRIEDRNDLDMLIMPYLDSVQYAKDDGETVTITSGLKRNVVAGSESGVSRSPIRMKEQEEKQRKERQERETTAPPPLPTNLGWEPGGWNMMTHMAAPFGRRTIWPCGWVNEDHGGQPCAVCYSQGLLPEVR